MSFEVDGKTVAEMSDLQALQAAITAQIAAIPAGTGTAGQQGPQGEPGPEGPPGPSGKDGTDAAVTLSSILAALGGSASGGSTTAPPATIANAFPLLADGKTPDLQNAVKPSPENSSMQVLGGVLAGVPYLIDAQGSVWQWLVDANGKPVPSVNPNGYKITLNGVQALDPTAFQQLTVRQGQVYFNFDSAAVGQFESRDSVGSGIQETALPPAFTTTGTSATGATTGLPAMPTPPAPSVPAPGSTSNVLLFGPKQTYATMQAAHDAANPGDTIQAGPELNGVTFTDVLTTTKPILLDLNGRITAGAGTETPTWAPGAMLSAGALADPTAYPHQLGGIVPGADIIIRGVDITGFGMQESGAGGTGAIRPFAACNIAIDHCKAWKNQNGVGPQDGVLYTLVFTNTFLLDNGLGVQDGRSHNVYCGVGCVSATFGPGFTSIVNPGVTAVAPIATAPAVSGVGGGHAVKSRAKVSTFIGPAYIYSSDAPSINLPDGSTQVCELGSGVTVAKKAPDANHLILQYGDESSNNGLAGVKGNGCTLNTECASPLIDTIGPIAFDNTCVFTGNPIAPNLMVTGLSTTA